MDRVCRCSRRTNDLLIIESVQEADTGIYRVEVENLHGKAHAYARLTMAPPPELRITEAMSFPYELNRHDWWELTNIDEPVNLAGYRWDDQPNEIGSGPTITNAVIVGPGESIVFMESETLESFRAWWGDENLPDKLKFVVYAANGLTESGDSIRLWNPSAWTKDDFIHKVTFSGAIAGSTYWFDTLPCSGFQIGVRSADRACGSVVASNGKDIGSPGWTGWTPPAFSHSTHWLRSPPPVESSGRKFEYRAIHVKPPDSRSSMELSGHL